MFQCPPGCLFLFTTNPFMLRSASSDPSQPVYDFFIRIYTRTHTITQLQQAITHTQNEKVLSPTSFDWCFNSCRLISTLARWWRVCRCFMLYSHCVCVFEEVRYNFVRLSVTHHSSEFSLFLFLVLPKFHLPLHQFHHHLPSATNTHTHTLHIVSIQYKCNGSL